jgi:hypothetical protein
MMLTVRLPAANAVVDTDTTTAAQSNAVKTVLTAFFNILYPLL